jgi:enamine deaminase RidA (YjgF/YER057c/UK114 family)
MSSKAQCIANLGEVLVASGSSWDKVVKVNIYLKNMDQFLEMNEIYETVRLRVFSRYFGDSHVISLAASRPQAS